MWRQHQDINSQLPHLPRVPHVLPPLAEVRVGDLGAGSSPADPHQLQSAFRSGGPGVQVSRAVSEPVHELQMCMCSEPTGDT